MKVRKEIIRPGTYTYIHPATGQPAKLAVTKELVKHFHDQGNAMLLAKLSVPVPMEHQPEARPQSESERAANLLKNNAGWTDGYTIGQVKRKDGTIIPNVLFADLDIQDADIAKKLPSTIKFTSPWITTFTDGAGKKWENVIGHNALTTRPRITEQQPFAHDMAAALSLVEGMKYDQIPDSGLELSLAGLLQSRAGKIKPKYPMAFSLLTGVRLSDDEIKEIEKDAEDEEVAETERESPLDAVADAPDMAKDVTIHETIGHLLKALGFHPPDGMDETTFERDLYETLMAKVQELGAKPAEKPPEETDEDGLETTNPVIQESPNMYATLAEISAISDPKERSLHTEIFKLRKESAETKKQAEANKKLADSVALSILNDARVNRQARIDRILNSMPVEKRQKLISRLTRPDAQLSLQDDGKVMDPMGEMLEILDSELATTRDMLTKAVVAPSPSMETGRSKAVVDEVLANTGGVPRTKS